AEAAFGQQGPVQIAVLMELSRTGATAGNNFDNGVKLAVKEINAAGGILSRKIEYTSMDTQSAPQTAKALAQKAVDQGAYVVMGPVFSGSFIVSMVETKRAEIPNFTGGEAANITQQGNPYVFRTSFTQSTAMPKLARYIKDTVKAKSVAMVWVNNDFGKGGRDSMSKALEEKFQKDYKYKSDHNGMKGYTGMYVVKAITERIKKFDGKEFAKTLHGATIKVKDYPGVLLDVHFDNNGDLDRESFLVKVEKGKQVVTATLPPVNPIQ